MDQRICYCFNYFAVDIRRDTLENGGCSRILEKILAAKKNGSCRCNEKHPEGR
jgi:hypothetical protein